MKSLKQFSPYALKYKKSLGLGLFFNFLLVFFSLVSAGTLMPILKIMFDKDKLQNLQPMETPVYGGLLEIDTYISQFINSHLNNWMIEIGPVSVLSWICIFGGILFMLKNVFRYLASFFMAHFKNGIIRSMREAMYAKLLQLHIGYFSAKNRGDIISRFSSDVSVIQQALVVFVEVAFRDPLMIIASLIVLFSISTKLTLFIFVALPIIGTLISLVGNSLKRNSKKAQDQEGRILAMVEEALHGLKIIKIFNATSQFVHRFDIGSKLWHQLANKVQRRNDLASPFSETFGVILFLLILWFGGSLILEDDGFMKPEVFLTYLVIFFQMVQPTKELVKMMYSLKKGDGAAERVHQFLGEKTKITVENPIAKNPYLENEIVLKKVNFFFKEHKVLENVSLTIKKGEKVALVGASGSGKTTLVHLLTRFYDVETGHISIDGVDIKQIELDTLRNHFGFVSQEPILFNDSIRYNLTLGNENISESDIQDAMRMAHVNEFVDKLDEGLEFNIGYSGNHLSGGQRQRLSIARAILFNPSVLIFDEATSALDNESEHLVQEAINIGMKDRTSIVIAHRLSTIKDVDRIIVMNEGKIVESGSHQELLDKQGHYHNLVQYMK